MEGRGMDALNTAAFSKLPVCDILNAK